MIHFEKEAGKFVAKNSDGSPHRCKDGKMIPTQAPVSAAPRMIGRLEKYDQCSATLTLRGGKKTVYAIILDRYRDFQKGALLLPAENHPDAWLDFAADKQGFILPGWKVIQPPEWAKELSDPTGGEVKTPPAKAPAQETAVNAPGAVAPTNPPTEPEKPAGTAPEPAPEDPEQMIQRAIAALMPSDRVGYRISLAGMVNSVIEMKKMSTDAPKTYAELEAEVKRDAVQLFLWCDWLTTNNIEARK